MLHKGICKVCREPAAQPEGRMPCTELAIVATSTLTKAIVCPNAFRAPNNGATPPLPPYPLHWPQFIWVASSHSPFLAAQDLDTAAAEAVRAFLAARAAAAGGTQQLGAATGDEAPGGAAVGGLVHSMHAAAAAAAGAGVDGGKPAGSLVSYDSSTTLQQWLTAHEVRELPPWLVWGLTGVGVD